MKKVIKYILVSIFALMITAFGGFYIWSEQTYKPSDELYALVGKGNIKIENGFVTFEPTKLRKWALSCIQVPRLSRKHTDIMQSRARKSFSSILSQMTKENMPRNFWTVCSFWLLKSANITSVSESVVNSYPSSMSSFLSSI